MVDSSDSSNLDQIALEDKGDSAKLNFLLRLGSQKCQLNTNVLIVNRN